MGDFLLAQSFPTPSHMHAGSFFLHQLEFLFSIFSLPSPRLFFQVFALHEIPPPSPSPSHNFSHGPSQNGVNDPGL